MANEGWHPEDIKAAIRKTGITITALALANGLEGSSIRVAIRRRHRAGERLISAFLRIPPHELWPDRYPAGTPIPRQHIRRRPAESRLKRKAA